MIKRALLIDLETTGVDPATDVIIEIGAVLYGVQSHTALLQLSAILPTEKRNAAVHINRIPQAGIAEMFDIAIDAMSIAASLYGLADVVVGHNCLEFDRVFLGQTWQTKPWLCTKTDFVWPQGKPGSSLVDIALAHGIGVASAHRALTDCGLIASLFDRMQDLPSMFEVALRPKFLHRALVEYDERQQAKDAGFQWNQPGHEKMWIRRMTREEADALPFHTVEIKGAA